MDSHSETHPVPCSPHQTPARLSFLPTASLPLFTPPSPFALHHPPTNRVTDHRHGCHSCICYPFSFSGGFHQVWSWLQAVAGAAGNGMEERQPREEEQEDGVCELASVTANDRVPDMGKRQLMNLLLLGAVSLPTAGMLVPYASFFVPAGVGDGSSGTFAKDALGKDIVAAEWLKIHGPGDRTLAQGLKGDPTYLVVENDRTLATYGLNAVCTHLGCVVPWNSAENKFICPCHGSQYNNQGKVVRGPAPLSLALAHVDVNVDDGKVVFVPWVETDFRTGEAPWWA
ncbi:Cytochrome b6-f complex iron-sulfur subunit [Nymphaea thermarum]|nr:Cytochrome b6-f complex iron-sulfur subunit [Nymphaea thermarum]